MFALAASCRASAPAGPVTALSSPVDETNPAQPYFSAPWPDDRRLHSDGTLNTLTFPNPEGAAANFFVNDLQQADHLVFGWGLASPIYMPFSGAIDTASLPPTPGATGPSVFIVVVDPSSPLRGQRNFADFHFYAGKTLFLPGNVLAVRPLPGFPLQPKTQYAVVVTTDLRDTSGNAVVAEASFARVMAGHPQGADEEAAATWFQPVVSELQREGFPLAKVASATLFTTQPLLDELLVLRDYVLAQPVTGIPDLQLASDQPASAPYWLFEGHYLAPNLQHGTPPYLLQGGDFEYQNAQGQPVPFNAPGATPVLASTESMRVAVVVPRGPVPPNGFPVVMYSHGTGGDFESIVDETNGVGPVLTQNGLAGFGIDQVLTGPRAGNSTASCFGSPIQDCYIDYVNAVAGRNNVRRSVLDNVFLRQVATNLVIPAAIDPDGVQVTFAKDRFGFVGHSQGGLTGALYSATDADLWGSVLSGAGGLNSGTIIQRQDPDAAALIEGPMLLDILGKESLDWYHPALALIQTLLEVVDPLNYAAYWSRTPTSRPKNIYATSGLLDEFMIPDLAEYMVAAAGLPRLLPIERPSTVLDLAGMAPVQVPVTGNITGGSVAVTGVFRQFPGVGHFAIFDCPGARAQYGAFLQTMLANGVATVPVDTVGCGAP